MSGRGQHRAGRSEPSWRDVLDTEGPAIARQAHGGYGHAGWLQRTAQRMHAPAEDDNDERSAYLYRAAQARHPSGSSPDAWDRHRQSTPGGLPYRLPPDDVPPEPEPVPTPPEPNPAWDVYDFVSFLAKRHPAAGDRMCGCGQARNACAVRYGLDMIDYRTDPGPRPA